MPTSQLSVFAGSSFCSTQKNLYESPIVLTGLTPFLVAARHTNAPASSGYMPVRSSFSIPSTEREILPP